MNPYLSQKLGRKPKNLEICPARKCVETLNTYPSLSWQPFTTKAEEWKKLNEVAVTALTM